MWRYWAIRMAATCSPGSSACWTVRMLLWRGASCAGVPAVVAWTRLAAQQRTEAAVGAAPRADCSLKQPPKAARFPGMLPPLPAGSFDANIDRHLKFWQSARWDGQSDSGAYVKERGGGDLHVALQWLTTLPPITQHVRNM